jgi:hypothetical protein
MRRTITLAAVLLLAAQAAYAEPDLADYRMLRKAKDRELTVYLSGLLAGFEWANARLTVEKKPLLYCQPGGFVFNAENAASMIDIEIAGPGYKDRPNVPVGLVLLTALAEQFPCRRGAQM